jgi:hypothetical protein
MNYFAHALRFLENPYFLAGTALPDWLSVVDRHARVTSKSAQRFVDHDDAVLVAVARGAIQHHRDDDWFHRTPAFLHLNLELSRAIRALLVGDEGFRPSFLGHILVEILLDAVLIEEAPSALAEYYRLLDSLNANSVCQAVNRMSTRPVPQLEAFIPLFSAERFLYDYADDGKLLGRLNRVLRRVGLPEVGDNFRDILQLARRRVRDVRTGLLDAMHWGY